MPGMYQPSVPHHGGKAMWTIRQNKWISRRGRVLMLVLYILNQHTMKNNSYLFSSESVSAGHPDKVADQISDAILDAYLTQDPEAKVACEVLITTGFCCIAGEITSTARVDAIAIAKEVIKEIGYDKYEYSFDYRNAVYENRLHQQSPEIFNSVRNGGAGDQGLMFGYACKDTPELMPLPVTLAHKLIQRQQLLRSTNELNWLLPDAKAQVTVLYEDGRPTLVDTIVFSTQHKSEISQVNLRELVKEHIIAPVFQDYFSVKIPTILINPSGSFTIGGPHGDTGLTGRKIIVDTYGGKCPHGGGAFSGKDPSKVDRSAAYMARYVAKHIVFADLAEECTVQLAYAIGKAHPVSVLINTHESGIDNDPLITKIVKEIFDFTPDGIINKLNLKSPIYRKTATNGHFGNDNYPWEKIDARAIAALRELINPNR